MGFSVKQQTQGQFHKVDPGKTEPVQGYFNNGQPGWFSFWSKVTTRDPMRPDRRRPPLLDEDAEATLTIVARARAETTNVTSVSMRIVWPDKEEEEEEILREVQEKRVTNPEDEEQYVDVEVVEVIYLRNKKTGQLRRIELRNVE